MHQGGVQHIVVSCAVVVSCVLHPMSHRVDQCSVSSYREAFVSQKKHTLRRFLSRENRQFFNIFRSVRAIDWTTSKLCKYEPSNNDMFGFGGFRCIVQHQKHFYRRKICKCVYELFDQHENLQ